MRLSRLIHRISQLNPKVEFLSIISWILFFPLKESLLYFLIFALLIMVFSVRNICFMKNLSLSPFSYFLVLFNLVLIFSIFFSHYPLKSILFVSDIFLVSLYFILFYFDIGSEDGYFHLLAYIISFMSLFNIFNFNFSIIDKKNYFFGNPILQGVASGIAIWILLYYLMNRFNWKFLVLTLINVGGLIVSQSKAAFLGFVAFFILMALLKNWKFLLVAVGIIILFLIIPTSFNPVKKAFVFSLTKDAYASSRIDIWQMSLTIFKDNFIGGVGAGNFSEVTKKYNFKQERGPANYHKRPRQPHNDYLKLLTETGIAGLLFLLLLCGVLFKKIFSSSLFNIKKLLILYLLFQALLIDLLFHVFFFFIFIFLLKSLLEDRLTYKSFTLNLKTYYTFLLVVTLLIGYLLPYLSQRLVDKAQTQENLNTVTRFNLLKKAGYLNPLDATIYYKKAALLYEYFKKTTNLESFYYALDNLKKAQRLNRYYIAAYSLESDLYGQLLLKNLGYAAIYEEIVAPLAKAEQYAPQDPFIKLKKAEIYFQFNHVKSAREEALKALELEPDYVSALYFLQRNFNYFPDNSTFKSRIDKIRNKASQIKPTPGTYLYALFKIPGKAGAVRGTGE